VRRESLPRAVPETREDSTHIVEEWARSGVMSLCGGREPDPSPAAAYAVFAAQLRALTSDLGIPATTDWADPGLVLSARAAELGGHRRGQTSCNGSTRLFRLRKGWWAVTLARPSDHELVPALLERELVGESPWKAIATESQRRGPELVERAAMLGLAAGLLGCASAPCTTTSTRIADRLRRPLSGALVLDFSALWAGPLATALLAEAGAHVVKVEWTSRPDGARHGSPRFFDWLNSSKNMFGVDDLADEHALRRLVDRADIVIESSRPRALRQRGLSVESLRQPPGRVWVRITAHGACPSQEHRIGFGDDAAVSGGLVAKSESGPAFMADAIADPLTGVRVAHEVCRSLRQGGGELIDVTLGGVASQFAELLPSPGAHGVAVHEVQGQWHVEVGGRFTPVKAPVPAPQRRNASAVGQDNAAVLTRWGAGTPT